MRFLIDAQLPPALARVLVANGHLAEHVADIGMLSAPDTAIWIYALEQSAVIVTKDEDFARRRALVRVGPTVVWVRVPNVRRRGLLVWFTAVLPRLEAALMCGETLIEIA